MTIGKYFKPKQSNSKVPLVIHAVHDQPTIFHITHMKAGSQWVMEVLKWCAYRRVVIPQEHSKHFSNGHIVQGLIYPTIYKDKQAFDNIISKNHNIDWKAFYIVRDLRDTLVSLYFSLLNSHSSKFRFINSHRNALSSLNKEDGLCYLIDGSEKFQSDLQTISNIQTSWANQQLPIFKYEKLIKDEREEFRKILLHCEIEVEEEHFQMVISNNSFTKLSGGRKPGDDDPNSHFRKGISGDWKNHLTPKVTDLFKRKYGQTLILSEYELNFDW